MAELNSHPLLVDVDWLCANIDSVRPIDGTWSIPGASAKLPEGYIKRAVSFDLDTVAMPHASLKHMLPTSEQFEKAVSAMGVKATDHIVCYDRHGVFSAPRLWWTFKMFGHKKVSVLDGGLPAWIEAGQPLQHIQSRYDKSEYKSTASLAKVTDKDGILNAINSEVQIVDARPEGRFNGTTAEPREGLRGGHMPSAINVSFSSLRTQTMHFKPIEDLIEAFSEIDPERPIITSCGSGITAAGLAFTLARLGAEDVTLYDGSWMDYGSDQTVPIIKKD